MPPKTCQTTRCSKGFQMGPREVVAKIVYAAIASSVLALCACTSPERPTVSPTPEVVVKERLVLVCPEVKVYTPAQYQGIHDEVANNPDLTYVRLWLKDYVASRDTAKLCWTKKREIELDGLQ